MFMQLCQPVTSVSRRVLVNLKQFQLAKFSSRQFLIDQYDQKKEVLKTKKLPPNVDPLGVFANDDIDLGEIDVYGFDYDYTLATYRTDVEQLIHHCAKQALVDKFKYPEAMLGFEYDPKFAIRGLHYDILNGLLLKVDSFIQINLGSVYRGRQQLKDEEVLAIYKRRHFTNHAIDQSDTHTGLIQMVDTFAKPKMCLLVDVIQWFLDQNISYEPQSIYEDVLACIEFAHPVFHTIASENPANLLSKDMLLRPYLEMLRSNGKQTFVITNSPFEIVNQGMRYILGQDWQKLFDVVIVSAKKPNFFKLKTKHFRNYSPLNKRLKWKPVLSLENGKIYTGGTLEELQRLTGWGDERVLYFGDHPYADLADLSMFSGWRTAAIIHELEDEITVGNDEVMKWNNNWSNVLQSLLEEHQDLGSQSDCLEVLNLWKEELKDLREQMKKHFNPQFGSVFRTDRTPTYFSRRLFRFADIYTSRVTNLTRYSPNHTFFPRRGVLPHEFRSFFN